MARSYHIDIAAFAADCDLKWIDNLLSHFSVAGVESARQGVARRLSLEAIQTIVLVRSLNQHAGLSIERGLQAAERLLSQDGDHSLGPWVELLFDGRGFRSEVDARVSEAVESIVPRRRGRPPGGARQSARK